MKWFVCIVMTVIIALALSDGVLVADQGGGIGLSTHTNIVELTMNISAIGVGMCTGSVDVLAQDAESIGCSSLLFVRVEDDLSGTCPSNDLYIIDRSSIATNLATFNRGQKCILFLTQASEEEKGQVLSASESFIGPYVVDTNKPAYYLNVLPDFLFNARTDSNTVDDVRSLVSACNESDPATKLDAYDDIRDHSQNQIILRDVQIKADELRATINPPE